MFKKIKGLVKNFEARGVLKQSGIGMCHRTEVRKFFETIENDIQKTNGDSDVGKINAIKERISFLDELNKLHENELSIYIEDAFEIVKSMDYDSVWEKIDEEEALYWDEVRAEDEKIFEELGIEEELDSEIEEEPTEKVDGNHITYKDVYSYKYYFNGDRGLKDAYYETVAGLPIRRFRDPDNQTIWAEAANEKKFILYNSLTNTEEELLTKLSLEIHFKKFPIQFKLYLPKPDSTFNDKYRECILEIYNKNEKVVEVRGFPQKSYCPFEFTDFIIVKNLNWIPDLYDVYKMRYEERSDSEDDGKEKKSYEEYLAKKNRSE